MATLRQTFSDIASAIRAKGVSGTMKPIEMATKIGEIQTGGVGYEPGEEIIDPETKPVCFKAMTDDVLIKLSATSQMYDNTDILLYSFDNQNWNSFGDIGEVHLKKTNDVVYFKNKYSGNWGEYDAYSDRYSYFDINGAACVSGNLFSLVTNSTPIQTGLYNMCGMFIDCKNIQINNLVYPSSSAKSTRGVGCFYKMFYKCSWIEDTGKLFSNVRDFENKALYSTFYFCTSLKRVYLTSITTIGTYGLNSTFGGCKSLELVDMSGAGGIPQLSDINCFVRTNDTYKVVVPDSLYDEWIVATNWSDASIVSHIMKKSDWNAEHPDNQL